MSDTRLSNLGKDLTKARQQALLIEVLQSDLESWADQSPDVFRTVCDASAAVFDADVKGGKTNVLMVGEAQGQEPLSIFGSLLGSLDNEFDDLHKRGILKRLTGFGLNQVLGGVVGEAVGDILSVGAGQTMEYLAELNGGAPDFLASAVESGVEGVADESGEIVGDIGGTGAEAIAGQFSSEDTIYLSRAARNRLKELAPRLRDKATSHETLQLALEMLLVTALGAPKVIVVKDPLRLDDASLALLAMLVSLEKDLRQANHTENLDEGMAQTASISVVLTFTGSQPNDTIENKSIEQKQQAISRLRMMASRYSLLERLDSDIPVPAVRASTFVGREQELKSLRQHWNSLCEQPDTAAKQTWCLIKGEPGTGKTALANRLIHQIRSDKRYSVRFRQSIPTLRMLNQTGHSAQATGLASLKNSMADELRRLALIYQEDVGWFTRSGQQITEGVQKWKDDAISDDPEAKKRMQGRVGKIVSKLLGVDAAAGIAGSVKDWSKQGEMRSMREQEFGQSSQANHKEEQFELLREALLEIRKLADKCTPDRPNRPAVNAPPFLLLIDDVQWMDDFTAEFLLNEWPANVPVCILATARGSDSFTTTGESSTHQAFNHYRNRLFSELGLIDAGSVRVDRGSGEEQEKEGKDKRDLSLASRLELKGMDQTMLANLIERTYADITKEQAEQFASGVIKNLAGENSASDVITLFAIETLNVISDENFYQRNPGLHRLIERLPSANSYCFSPPKNKSLIECIDTLFNYLKGTYEASYLIGAGGETVNVQFNLASYAVLEERLYLIEKYFGKYGGTARYSLTFSSILGIPFQSELVEYLIKDLKNLVPEKHPDLSGLILELQENCRGSLRLEDYEILERAYEIVRKLEGSALVRNKYLYQHGLIQHFLLGQFAQLLYRIYPNSEKLKCGLQALVIHFEEKGDEWFDDYQASDNRKFLDRSVLNVERYRFLAELNGYWYRFMNEKSTEPGEAGERYVFCLNHLAIALRDSGRVEDSYPLLEEALGICQKGKKTQTMNWSKNYVATLTHLALTLKEIGQWENCLQFMKEANRESKKQYKIEISRINSPKYDSETWEEIYTNTLNSLGGLLHSNGDLKRARPMLKKALKIRLSKYKESPEIWSEFFTNSLSNYARLMDDLGKKPLAVRLLKEVVSIRQARYQAHPEQWAKKYSSSLSSLALVQHSSNYFEYAMQHSRISLKIVEARYKKAQKPWVLDYVSALLAYVSSNGEPDSLSIKISHAKEATLVVREEYKSAPGRWSNIYIQAFRELAKIAESLDKCKNDWSIIKGYEDDLRACYVGTPPECRGDFVNALISVSDIYRSENFSDSEKQLLDLALPVCRELYDEDPNGWADSYLRSLFFLFRISWNKKSGELPSVFEEIVCIYNENFSIDSKVLDKVPKSVLINLVNFLSHCHYWSVLTKGFEQLLPLLKLCYENNFRDLESGYSVALRLLALGYFKTGDFERSFLYGEIAVNKLSYVSKEFPEEWEAYNSALMNLAMAFLSINRPIGFLSRLEKMLPYLDSKFKEDKGYWGATYTNVLCCAAKAYLYDDRPGEAIPYYKLALSIFKDTCITKQAWDAEVHNTISESYRIALYLDAKKNGV